jgi:cell division protein FtsB
MGYLLFAAVQGEYGLVRLFQVEGIERQLSGDLHSLRRERLMLENLSGRLSSGAVDLELLDERARAVLGLIHEDEIVIR